MASKGPKKKESKDQVPSTTKELSQSSNTSQVNDDKTSAKKKSPIPLWPEWTDQEIANEKWDLAKKEKERGRSPNAAAHYFDDPEGLIDLPITLKTKVHAWKRPVDIIPDEIVPVVIEPSNTSCSQLDILTPNEHIICSEVICSIVSSITTLHQFFMPNRDSPAFCPSKFKTNLNIKEPPKDSKADRGAGKKDGDVAAAEELPWKPWDLIWPKESTKPGSMPLMNSSGKYVVKLYWMGCYRKITIDDTIPCDVDMKPLLPFTTNGNELWPMILAKALIKVASLDYFGGREGSEMGEVNFIHCLTGWMPELIPLDGVYSDKIWKLLLQVLPNWKLPQPPSQQTEEVNTTNVTANTSLDVKTLQSLTENQNLGTSKLELNTKESTYKNKKDEKSKDETTKKSKTNDKDPKTTKEKLQTPNVALKQSNLSQHLIFASFKGSPIISNMNSTTINKDFADLKRDSAASSKLREFGLIRSLPHPVHVSVARNCPLIPPPTPVQIPRWKLIRQKKKVETSEPSLHPKEYKEPKFVELKTPFLNFKVRPTPVSSANLIGSRSSSHTPMASLTEEIMNKDGTIDLPQEQIPTQPNVSSDSTKDMTETKDQHQNLDASSNSDVKSERKLSFESQSGTAVTVAPPKSPRHSKSRIAVSSKGRV
eukprot:TCONS_00023273-protein